jgi:hypothetical protein
MLNALEMYVPVGQKYYARPGKARGRHFIWQNNTQWWVSYVPSIYSHQASSDKNCTISLQLNCCCTGIIGICCCYSKNLNCLDIDFSGLVGGVTNKKSVFYIHEMSLDEAPKVTCWEFCEHPSPCVTSLNYCYLPLPTHSVLKLSRLLQEERPNQIGTLDSEEKTELLERWV